SSMTVSGTIPIFANTKMLSMATSRLGMRAFDQIEVSSPNALNARTTAAAQMASMRGPFEAGRWPCCQGSYEIRRLWVFPSYFPIVENSSCLGVRQLLCQGIVWAYEFSAVPARAWIDRASGIRESTVGDRPPRLFGRGPGEQSGGRRRGPGARRGLHRGRHLDERR